MENNIEILQAVISAIGKRSEMEGSQITLDEIILKAGITMGQLQAFLSGEEIIPRYFITKLNNLYGFKLVPIRSVEYLNFNESDEDEKVEEVGK